jgi:hypothetical protein
MWIFLRIHFSKPPKKRCRKVMVIFFHHFSGIFTRFLSWDGGC